MQIQLDRPTSANPLHDRLFAGLKDEPLNFLTSSAGMVRLIDRASRDDCTIEEAANLVHNEPLVSAKMVAMANSAAYSRGDRVVTNVKDALGMLGLGILKAVASAVLVGQMADKAAQPNQLVVSRLWAHSIEVAALASVLARNFTRVPPETALFAGIVHEIAGFYLLSKADKLVDLAGSDVVAVVHRDEARQEEASTSMLAVGTRRLLHVLQVPEEVSDAIDGLWRGYLIVPPETLADVLLVANIMAATPSPFDSVESKAKATGLDLDDVLSKSEVAVVLKQAYEQVRSIQQAFMKRGA
ncbi:MAG: HDOD domain-containing protein [Variovorax sp.]